MMSQRPSSGGEGRFLLIFGKEIRGGTFRDADGELPQSAAGRREELRRLCYAPRDYLGAGPQ